MIGFIYRAPLIAEANNIFYISPCDTPKTFRIGTIDSRFDISKEELINDAEIAASAWRNNKGMTLLTYDPDSTMPINMIYDQRQSLNSQINTLNNQVTLQKNSLKPEISDYEQKSEAFKKQSEDLNAQIQYWNSKGGAPQDVYEKLTAEQQTLQAEASHLQQEAAQLNQSTDQYNQQIRNLNQKVDNFNTVLSSSPEEGEYTRDGADEKINIYITNSNQELIHTLAHEMGHALGLGHNNNPSSIMYPYTNTAVIPSIDDANALIQACQKKTIIQVAAENIVLFATIFKKDVTNVTIKYL